MKFLTIDGDEIEIELSSILRLTDALKDNSIEMEESVTEIETVQGDVFYIYAPLFDIFGG